MCNLATVYCDYITNATIDGVRRNLRDEAGGHHNFVYGETDTFPTHVESYLKAIGHQKAESYRTSAIALRNHYREDSVKHYHNYIRRPAERAYVECRADSVAADPFATVEDWEVHLQKLAQLRVKRLVDTLRTNRASKFSESEWGYLRGQFPLQTTEYFANIAAEHEDLSGLSKRAKQRHRSRKAWKKRVRLKGKALAQQIEQTGHDGLLARVLASATPTQQPMAMAG